MSVRNGQRIVSIRKRMIAYCEEHNIVVPASFHDIDTIYPIIIIDTCIEEQPHLVPQTFYNDKSVLRYLKDENKNPLNYKILDFKRGIEIVLQCPIQLIRGEPFDNRKDVDIQR